MGEFYLIQPRKFRFKPKTTNSNHQLTIYPNQIKDLGTVVPNHVWVSNIIYIAVNNTWCYLALIMDQGSRKIVGWAIQHSMQTELCLEALEMALKNNPTPAYHHSDRGSQYCSREYREVLKKNNIKLSMADVGMSVDNPFAESLNRSLKVEEVYRNDYEDIYSARLNIGKWIDKYNNTRLHSSLGYTSPVKYLVEYYKSA